uniref:Uncharacterized protein n=1 Tax=Kalanchoe fedtschenkoi TaxID=63787 RepID=A0A7N0RD72_KALFE
MVSLKGQKPAAPKPERAEVVICEKQLSVVAKAIKISLKDCLACRSTTFASHAQLS